MAEIEVDPVEPLTAGGHGGERELLHVLVGELLDARPDLAARVTEVIASSLAFSGATGSGATGAVPSGEVREVVDAHLAFLGHTDGRLTPERQAPRAFGRHRAQQDVELPELLDAFRAGARSLWAEVVDYGRDAGAADDTTLLALTAEYWLLHDEFAARIAEGHRAEMWRIEARRQAERSALVDALLTGRHEGDLRDAAARLGLPAGAEFVVVAVRAQRLAEDPMPGVDRELETARIPSAWRLRADARLGIVVLDSGSTQGARRHRSEAPAADPLEVARHVLRQTGATVGISPRLQGWSFAESGLRFALIALEAAPDGEVADFGERPMSVMAAAAPDVARRAAAHVLEGLDAASDVERRLLVETVRTWFDHGGSAGDAADALFVHASTVRNRLHRFEELTKRTLADPRDAAEVLFAFSARGDRWA